MLKKLMMTAAVVALAATAQAQDTQTPATPDAGAITGDDLMFFETPTSGAHLASNLIGETVYSSEADDAETIGEINDLIVAENGAVEAVVIGVGGFLGVGEKNVAVEFDDLTWATPTTDEPAKLVLSTTADQLQAAPEFDISALEPEPAAGPAGPTADDTAMAPGAMTPETATPGAAPADELAAAPSDTLSEVDVASVSANDLIGTTVYSADNENVGSVADVILADDGTIDAVVLDIGGFLGIGTKPVAIGFDSLTIRRDQNETLFVYTAFTRDLLESAPDYDSERYPAERETMRLRTAT